MRFAFDVNSDGDLDIYVTPNGILPTRGTEESAGLDLYADLTNNDGTVTPYITVKPGFPVAISSGVVIDFPKGCVGFLDIRSSLGKHGLDLACRTIDADYRGIISLIVKNDGNKDYVIRHGDKIAQIILLPCAVGYKPKKLADRASLSTTKRGERGFGSTGST
jgi:dUTP pyrophosphatase